jgi:hypothetical protein
MKLGCSMYTREHVGVCSLRLSLLRLTVGNLNHIRDGTESFGCDVVLDFIRHMSVLIKITTFRKLFLLFFR